MESTAPFRDHYGTRNAHAWFHLDRSSTPLLKKDEGGTNAQLYNPSKISDISPESQKTVQEDWVQSVSESGIKCFRIGSDLAQAPGRKMYKSANPNLKNPATNSKPKKIRCCMFFGAEVANFLSSKDLLPYTSCSLFLNQMTFQQFVCLFLGALVPREIWLFFQTISKNVDVFVRFWTVVRHAKNKRFCKWLRDD